MSDNISDNTMLAAHIHDYGSPEVLTAERVPRPQPGEGEVLERVHAAGVNPFDSAVRAGYTKDFMPITLPYTLGLDLAGTVEAVGPGVTAFQKGQAVYGTGSGTYAEYAVAPASNLAPMPRNLSFDEAASIPTGARTAWMGVIEAGELQPGQRLLVHGAAGGVGIYAVQFGRWKGAQVIGTASAENADFVRSLGAETVIDYNSTPFETVVRDVDVVFDTVGGETTERSWQVLKPGGILISIAGAASEEKAREYGVRVARAAQPPSLTEVLQRITELIESGAVVPTIQKVFPLEQADQAHALSDTRHGRGRIVLHIAD